MDGKYSGFRVERKEGHITLLTFDRPDRLNTLTANVKRDLVELVSQVQMDRETKVLVLTGEGKGFCGGDEIGGGEGEFHTGYWKKEPDARVPHLAKSTVDSMGSYASLKTTSQPLSRAFRDLEKITIAAINGHAIQSGFSLALTCDFRIAARRAKLGSATLRFGFLPDEGGHHLLVQHIGLSRTLDFLLRNRIVGAEEALRMGLVNEVVDDGKEVERALALARELAEGPQVAMRLLKRAIYGAAELTFGQAAEDIATKAGIADHHPDTKEGIKAFREKRRPKFSD